MLKLGPTDMRGEIRDEKGRIEIVEIQLTCQVDRINSIRFTYKINGKVVHSKNHGIPNGLKFDMGQYLFGDLASITFVTNNSLGTDEKKYGPFGTTGCQSSSYKDFKFNFKSCRFGGFHAWLRISLWRFCASYWSLQPYPKFTLFAESDDE
ncbi:hypothetical protein R6Q57_011492 [Mikania cordata]